MKGTLILIPTLVLAALLQGCNSQGDHDLTQGAEAGQGCIAGIDEEFLIEVDPESQGDVVEEGRGRRIHRHRTVKVNHNSFKRALRRGERSRLQLNLFNDRLIRVFIDKVDHLSADNIVAVGEVEGDPLSSVTVVLKDQVLVANIRNPFEDENFEIRYQKNGVHTVQAVEVTDEAQCAAYELPQVLDAEDSGSDSYSYLQAAPIIDMLVAYTPAARSKHGGTNAMIAIIQAGIADTNRAFSDSGVNLSVRLVGTLEVRQNESSDFSADLTALRSKTDGKWDEVHAERERLGADQVSLIGAYAGNSSVAGIGYVNASAASAFTITKSNQFIQYTFTHELGHNIGLNHSDGLENSSGRFRTIMAYGSYSRIRRFSNPSLAYNGYSTGDSSRNSSRILNANGSRTASLLQAVVPPVSTPAPTPGGSNPPPTPEEPQVPGDSKPGAGEPEACLI